MEADQLLPQTLVCAVVAVDHSKAFYYRVCSTCERPLADSISICRYCDHRDVIAGGSSTSKRLFRVLMSIASDTKVSVVICFDRVAKVFFGCSADEFFHFAKLHPFAAATASKILEGEMFRMTLTKPRNGNAEHLRVASVIPLRTGFQPVIESLREVYDLSGITATVIAMLEGKAIVGETDMLQAMQQDALHLAAKALDYFDVTEATAIARFIKKEFDTSYGPGWQCIVGTDFGSFVTHCQGCFIYFCVGSLSILLFRGSAGPETAEAKPLASLESIKA